MTARAGLHSPLLNDAEIRELIRRARAAAFTTTGRIPPRQGRSGEQQSPTLGGGSDFAEVRAYQAGDDPRRIDWRATARSRAPLVRSYHAELSQPLYLMIDRSASMRFATRTRLKVTQAMRCALWLAAGALDRGRELAAVLIDHPCHWLPPRRGSAALETLIALGNRPCPPVDPGTQPPAWEKLLASLRQQAPAGAELWLLSDFNAPELLESRMLGALGQHGPTRAVVISDPVEQRPSTDLQDLELRWGTQQRMTGPQALRALADAQAQWHSDLLKKLQRSAISHITLSTGQDGLPLAGMAR